MSNNLIYKVIKIFIASVWIINGLFCKILNLVPRHKEIVGEILGQENSTLFTQFIGFAEILMAIWILSNLFTKLNVFTQIIIILTMNCLEFIIVPEYLLWGRINILFACSFCLLIYTNEYFIKEKSKS